MYNIEIEKEHQDDDRDQLRILHWMSPSTRESEFRRLVIHVYGTDHLSLLWLSIRILRGFFFLVNLLTIYTKAI